LGKKGQEQMVVM